MATQSTKALAELKAQNFLSDVVTSMLCLNHFAIMLLHKRVQGYLPFTWKFLEIPVGKSNDWRHSVPGKLQKIWAVVCDEVIFLVFVVCSADLDIV